MARRSKKPSSSGGISRAASRSPQTAPSAEETLALRTAFWQHIVRDMLTTMAVMRGREPRLFDGRMAILTHGGERIAIASIHPLFACGIPGTPAEQSLSIAVESSVFRIRTPEGEVFTLPVSEVRALHALSSDLVKSLEAGTREATAPHEPFGFAAFTSLSRGAMEPSAPASPKRRTRPKKSRKPSKRAPAKRGKKSGTR